MVICDKNDLLHAHMVGEGVVIIGSWSLPLLIVTALVFSITTVFRCSFLPRVVSLLFSVVKAIRFSAVFFTIMVHKY